MSDSTDNLREQMVLAMGTVFLKHGSDSNVGQLVDAVLPVIEKHALEARIKATQKFSGLYGIGGDGNDHVATYRKVYAEEMAKLNEQLQATKPEKEGA